MICCVSYIAGIVSIDGGTKKSKFSMITFDFEMEFSRCPLMMQLRTGSSEPVLQYSRLETAYEAKPQVVIRESLDFACSYLVVL